MVVPAERAPESRDPKLTGSSLLSPGEVVGERYRIEHFLRGGGMAAIYRATHTGLEQPVAIKVLSPRIHDVPGMAARFLREARAATQLKGEHVVRVYDVGTTAAGAPYLVMELLEGEDLDALLEGVDAPLPVETAIDYALQACEALAEVHGLGIVHRDLKPANLFLTTGTDGLPCVKLIDFGISRVETPLTERDLAIVTNPDVVMGSPRYMSPEQMESAARAEPRSDLYGICAVLYELLTTEPAHDGESFIDIYASATLHEPTAPSTLRDDVPAGLDEVVLRGLRAEAAERYEDAAELAEALAPFGPEGSHARAERIARVLAAAAARGRSDASGLRPSEASDDTSTVRRIRRSAPPARSRSHASEPHGPRTAPTFWKRRAVRTAATFAVAFALGVSAVHARAALDARGDGWPATVPAAQAAVPPTTTHGANLAIGGDDGELMTCAKAGPPGSALSACDARADGCRASCRTMTSGGDDGASTHTGNHAGR